MANTSLDLDKLTDLLSSGGLVPYLGPGALDGVVEDGTEAPIPAKSDSLILAMNDGKPMAPRLMYEFPRAAMNLENKRGRKFIERFLDTTYLQRQWSVSPLHQRLADLHLPYIIDINRDTQLQDLYRDRAHTLIVGVARIAGSSYRFRIYQFTVESGAYSEIDQEAVDVSLPVLFKPMGSPVPEANYIASDADYVDYITELMGGFAIPSFLKTYRLGKQYLFLGLRMQRDTERMVMSDIVYGAPDNCTGWAFLTEPTEKEARYCRKKRIEILEEDGHSLLEEVAA
jgi:hypothetical protein